MCDVLTEWMDGVLGLETEAGDGERVENELLSLENVKVGFSVHV